MSAAATAIHGEVLDRDVFVQAREILLDAQYRLSLLGIDPEEALNGARGQARPRSRRAKPMREAQWHRDPSSRRFLF